MTATPAQMIIVMLQPGAQTLFWIVMTMKDALLMDATLLPDVRTCLLFALMGMPALPMRASMASALSLRLFAMTIAPALRMPATPPQDAYSPP